MCESEERSVKNAWRSRYPPFGFAKAHKDTNNAYERR
ncbi:MAG: hypothetical protein KatS3mg007_0742 [Thermoanaerobaculum sp.]|jgi:hypothetical protein|nr:MAG: hypothetical protein KatS3mg007_0742 [Thermoanaerobaculum sp.]